MAKKKATLDTSLLDLELDDKQKGRRARRKKIKRVRESVSFKDAFSDILSLEVPSEALAEAIKSSPLGDKINYREAILLAQIIKATNGDTQAATFVRDTSGNKLKESDGKDIQRKKFEDF